MFRLCRADPIDFGQLLWILHLERRSHVTRIVEERRLFIYTVPFDTSPVEC